MNKPDTLKLSKDFILLRLAFSVICCLIYVLICIGFQNLYVKIFGISKFNYIVGGIFALICAGVVTWFISKVLFFFARGYYIGAVARSDFQEIPDSNMLDFGREVFQKNITSFVMLMGLAEILRRVGIELKHAVVSMFNSVPYVSEIIKIGNKPIVRILVSYILYYSYDAVIFDIIKNSEDGIKDDLPAITNAVKNYAFSLFFSVRKLAIPAILFGPLVKMLIAAAAAIALFYQGVTVALTTVIICNVVWFLVSKVVIEPIVTTEYLFAYNQKTDSELPEQLSEAISEALAACSQSLGIEIDSMQFKRHSKDTTPDCGINTGFIAEDDTIPDTDSAEEAASEVLSRVLGRNVAPSGSSRTAPSSQVTPRTRSAPTPPSSIPPSVSSSSRLKDLVRNACEGDNSPDSEKPEPPINPSPPPAGVPPHIAGGINEVPLSEDNDNDDFSDIVLEDEF